ncbi:trypsin-like peptidase domain-containing protein [Streptomyces sp. NPDC051940]|uniref:VMAP-C domain-containing protein n=1 Tax=Streptomyces sp. NPDC051940 TaxID=3155675 RepID=UPI0034374B91
MSPEDAEAELIRYAHRTTVGIRAAPGAADDQLWGSGVLVAPGWVLTCAHLFIPGTGETHGLGPGEEIGVVLSSRREPVRARVAYCPRPPFRADVALVRLSEEIPDQPCAWLGDRSLAYPERAAVLGRLAHPEGGGTGAAAIQLVSVPGGMVGVAQTIGTEVPKLEKGMSGGPVLDRDRGEVVGITKGRYRDRPGGGAVPLTGLRMLTRQDAVFPDPGLGDDPYDELIRRHDRWHWKRQSRPGATWVDYQRHLRHAGPRLWHVQHRLKAMHLLAGLPPAASPAEVERLVYDALGMRDRPEGSLLVHSWRDGLGEIYQENYAEFRGAVHYLKLVAAAVLADDSGHVVARRLASWAREELAMELRAEDRDPSEPGGRVPTSLLVSIEPLYYSADGTGPSDTFNWSIWRGYGDGEWRSVTGDQRAGGVSFEAATRAVLERLGDPLLAADAASGAEGPVRLEVALPPDRLADPVHTWRLPVSRRRGARLRPAAGRRPVVVRDATRADGLDPNLDRRWVKMLNSHRLQPVHVTPQHARLDELESLDGHAVPVLCHAPGARTAEGPLVDWLLDTGFPVAFWRTDGHPEGPCHRGCEIFLADAARAIEQSPADPRALPERLRALRAGGISPHSLGGCGVLLYEDPSNPLPRGFVNPLETA